MTFTKQVKISCDIPWCHKQVSFDHQYGPAARRELAEAGWAHVERKDYCPRHATLGSGHLQSVPESAS